MPVIRTQTYGWQSSEDETNDDNTTHTPYETFPSPPSTMTPHSPLSPALYSLQRQTDATIQSPISLSTTSSRRTSIDSAQSITSDRRAQRNLERDPSWVPRPRNAFIIFRCDYAKEHCLRKDGGSSTSSTGKEVHGEKTLSKRASEAWNNLPTSERERYKELAEIEKEEHTRAHPGYRFRPFKRMTPTKRNSQPPWLDTKVPPPVRRSQTETPEMMLLEYLIRHPSGRRFSESHVEPNLVDPPIIPVKVDKQVKAARRRSSSVPLPGTEHGQYILPWLTPEEPEHLLLRPMQPLQKVDPRLVLSGSSMLGGNTLGTSFSADCLPLELFDSGETTFAGPSLVQVPQSYGTNSIQTMQQVEFPRIEPPVPEVQWLSAEGASWALQTQSPSAWGQNSVPFPLAALPSTSTYGSHRPRETAQYPLHEQRDPTWSFGSYDVPEPGYQFPPRSMETIQSGEISPRTTVPADNDSFRMVDTERACLNLTGEMQAWTGLGDMQTSALGGNSPPFNDAGTVTVGEHHEQATNPGLPVLDFGEYYLTPG